MKLVAVVCNLSPETYEITIFPFQIFCPNDIITNIENSSNAIYPYHQPPTFADCEYETIRWEMSGATEGTSDGFVGKMISTED